jgi:quercetin dioxygenase-like cupin family protein
MARGGDLILTTRDSNLAILIDGAATAGRFALLSLTIARGEEPPCHRHHWEDEALFVLAGTLRVRVADHWTEVTAGTAVFLPRAVEHAFVVTTPVARLLVALTPAGFEGCYSELGGAAAPSLERLVATTARYGCEVTGPSANAEELPGGP